jgi:hypothetical protein
MGVLITLPWLQVGGVRSAGEPAGAAAVQEVRDRTLVPGRARGPPGLSASCRPSFGVEIPVPQTMHCPVVRTVIRRAARPLGLQAHSDVIYADVDTLWMADPVLMAEEFSKMAPGTAWGLSHVTDATEPEQEQKCHWCG